MTVTYRLMCADDEPAVLALVCEAFQLPDLAYQAARFAADPAAHAHTYVADTPNAGIVSTLHYRVTLRCDATGAVRQVGELDTVATRADARRQGHATQLLQLALEALHNAGCDWSLLLASGEESRMLYERYGWRCYGESWRRGTLTGALPQQEGCYLIRPYDPSDEPNGWDPIAAVEMAFNRERPLTVVRTRDYWRRHAAPRISNWITDEGLIIFAAFRSGADTHLCGFAFAEFYHLGFQVRDMGVLPEEADAVLPLLAAVAAEAQRRGLPLTGRMYLPREPAIDAALERLFGPTLHTGQNIGHLMARTIAPSFTTGQLDAVFNAPTAHFSAIDLF